jgi:predicted type IV restriction endonuclease
LPELSSLEQERLDRVIASYLNLTMRQMLENMVKMVVLSPLLDLAGFYLPPFFTTSEAAIEISLEDNNEQIKGRMDLLVMQDRLWVLVIESKQAGISLEPGIPQLLAYMLANPDRQLPIFGLVTNGSNFIFAKLQWQEKPLICTLG